MFRFAAVILAVGLGTPDALAGQYYASPPDPPVPNLNFQINTNCAGCPKGDKVAVHPAVYEFLLSRPESFVRSHYAGFAGWTTSGQAPPNDMFIGMFQGDADHIYGAQKAMLDAGTGASDLAGVLAADSDGVWMARAVGLATAEAANAMVQKKGWAQWFWGWRWEKEGETWKTPTMLGNVITLVVFDEAAQTASVHLWGKGMVTTVRKASAVFDLSGVPGAFDPSASLDFAAVEAGAKALDAKLPVAMDGPIILRKK